MNFFYTALSYRNRFYPKTIKEQYNVIENFYNPMLTGFHHMHCRPIKVSWQLNVTVKSFEKPPPHFENPQGMFWKQQTPSSDWKQ